MSFQSVLGKDKAVIAMVHFPPLPGTPGYDSARGVVGLLDSVRRDLEALQSGGVDALMFGNEGDRPYVTSVGPEVPATMARVIGELKSELSVPFGVDVLWDPKATIALAVATGARFVREVFTGLYGGDLGLWNPQAGEATRFRHQLGGDDVKLLFNINAEFASPLDERSLSRIAKSVAFSSVPDAICVSGPMTGESMSFESLQEVKLVIGEVPVIANTGVRADNVAQVLAIADAVIVGTALKHDGITWNAVDRERVKHFMSAARQMAA